MKKEGCFTHGISDYLFKLWSRTWEEIFWRKKLQNLVEIAFHFLTQQYVRFPEVHIGVYTRRAMKGFNVRRRLVPDIHIQKKHPYFLLYRLFLFLLE